MKSVQSLLYLASVSFPFAVFGAPRSLLKHNGKTAISVVDPSLESEFSAQSAPSERAPEKLPHALRKLRPSEAGKRASRGFTLENIEKLIRAGQWGVAKSQVKLILALDRGLDSGDRLRLLLVQALLEAQLGQQEQAQRVLRHAKEFYFSHATALGADQRTAALTRLDLWTAIGLVEYDILKEAEAL